MTKAKWFGIVESIILVVLGILLVASLADSSIIDYIIGSALVAGGVIYLALGIIQKKGVLNAQATFGTLLVGAGIVEFLNKSISNFIGSSAAWFLFIFGALLIVNALVWLIGKYRGKAYWITALVFGVALLTLGALLLFPYGNPIISQQWGWVIYGIVFILFGVLLFVSIMISLSKKKK